jgi:hypothetical protein
MNANDDGVNENDGNVGSLEPKKKKRDKRIKEKKRRKKEKKKRKRRIPDSEPENRKKAKKSKERKLDKDAKVDTVDDESVGLPGPSVPAELLTEQAKARAPMTKEEWEKSQNVIRKVFDETTGRTRFVAMFTSLLVPSGSDAAFVVLQFSSVVFF